MVKQMPTMHADEIEEAIRGRRRPRLDRYLRSLSTTWAAGWMLAVLRPQWLSIRTDGLSYAKRGFVGIHAADIIIPWNFASCGGWYLQASLFGINNQYCTTTPL